MRRAALARAIQDKGCVTVNEGVDELIEIKSEKSVLKIKKDWVCALCTLVNSCSNCKCSACNTPECAVSAWVCKHCTYLNTDGSSICQVCKKVDLIIIE